MLAHGQEFVQVEDYEFFHSLPVSVCLAFPLIPIVSGWICSGSATFQQPAYVSAAIPGRAALDEVSPELRYPVCDFSSPPSDTLCECGRLTPVGVGNASTSAAEMLHDNPGHREVPEPMVVGRNNEPRGMCSAATGQGLTRKPPCNRPSSRGSL